MPQTSPMNWLFISFYIFFIFFLFFFKVSFSTNIYKSNLSSMVCVYNSWKW